MNPAPRILISVNLGVVRQRLNGGIPVFADAGLLCVAGPVVGSSGSQPAICICEPFGALNSGAQRQGRKRCRLDFHQPAFRVQICDRQFDTGRIGSGKEFVSNSCNRSKLPRFVQYQPIAAEHMEHLQLHHIVHARLACVKKLFHQCEGTTQFIAKPLGVHRCRQAVACDDTGQKDKITSAAGGGIVKLLDVNFEDRRHHNFARRGDMVVNGVVRLMFHGFLSIDDDC